MKFGPVALADAQGAILAHSIAIPSGRLRKGAILSAQNIEALRHAGCDPVIVARLDPGDVHEDDAAWTLAQAAIGSQDWANVSLTKAFTGRVNVLASGPGVVELDVAGLQAANAVDPMITVATVPPWQQMQSGGMIATIKIISYAVPAASLAKAVACLREGAIRLQAPNIKKVDLIITEIPGGAAEKGKEAILDRLAALDVRDVSVQTVRHQQGALTKAIGECCGDLILILTGSATSDLDDVAPSAVRAARGEIKRFGMPVDPGNLLFLGACGQQVVIGLPGCARSPALNGADWVLSRVVCGIAVTSEDIAQMGIGGLLKEIPTRPQPRRGRKDGI